MNTVTSSGPPVDRLSLLLKEIKLDDSTAQEGLFKLYDELKECYEAQERVAPAGDYTGEHDEELKQLCTQASLFFVARVLFVVQSREGRTVSAYLGCPISRIIAAAGINLLDFFREVNVVVSKLSAYFEARGGSSRLFTQQAQLKENSETVVVMGLLAKKYKDNFNLFLHQLDFYKQLVLRLGWSAFLVLRVKLLSTFPDVVSCVELLPCVFAILASHAPRLPDCLSHVSQERKPALLQAMSEMCKADFSRVNARMTSVESLLLQILVGAVPEWRTAVCAARERAMQASTALDLVSNPVLEGLVTDGIRMEQALAALEAEYEHHYVHGGSELDEREFLYTDFAKFASPRLSPGHIHSAMVKLRSGFLPLRQGALLGPGAHTTAPSAVSPHFLNLRIPMPAGMQSPLPLLNLGIDMGQPNTPVSEVMNASAWLRALTANLEAEPTPGLVRYLSAVGATRSANGSATAVHQLGQRVRDLVSSIMPEEKAPSLVGPFPLFQSSLAAERRSEVTKLYYHSLDSILQTEEKVSGMPGVTSLLLAGKFHRALIACCVEVVAACYRMVSCSFPKVLDALHIKAFDLAKMIQSFVKSVETLPRELKRHLFQIEEKILESLAWEPGSSLYSHIITISNDDSPTRRNSTLETSTLHLMLDDGFQHAYGPQLSSACIRVGGAGVNVLNDGGTIDTALLEGCAVPADKSSPGPSMLLVHAVSAPSPKRTQGSIMAGLASPAKKVRVDDGSPQPVQVIAERLPRCIGPIDCGVAGSNGNGGALHDFCRKVLKLAAFRLALMCDNFDFKPLDRVEVNAKVYETIEYALYYQTHMFYNRHIDQIILSALYGYCKVQKLAQVSFREIIGHYRKQPQAQQCVFRSVIIEQSNPELQVINRADIIAFYNHIFVPSMKSFLLRTDTCSVGTIVQRNENRGMDYKWNLKEHDGYNREGNRNSVPIYYSNNSSLPNVPADEENGAQVVAAEIETVGKIFSAPIVADASSNITAPIVISDHQIPDGLAALLQALDSQQNFQEQ